MVSKKFLGSREAKKAHRKSAPRCGAEHGQKSRALKTDGPRPHLDDEMSTHGWMDGGVDGLDR